MTHGSVAKSVRLNKEKYPERYCANPTCLWNISSGNPCPKHPDAAPKVLDPMAALLASLNKKIAEATS